MWPRLKRLNAICPGTVQAMIRRRTPALYWIAHVLHQTPLPQLAPRTSRLRCSAWSRLAAVRFVPCTVPAVSPASCWPLRYLHAPDVCVTTASLVTGAGALRGECCSACGDRRPFRTAAARERQTWTQLRSSRGARQLLRSLLASWKSSSWLVRCPPRPALAMIAFCAPTCRLTPRLPRAADHSDWDAKDWQWDPVSLTALPRSTAAAQISRSDAAVMVKTAVPLPSKQPVAEQHAGLRHQCCSAAYRSVSSVGHGSVRLAFGTCCHADLHLSCPYHLAGQRRCCMPALWRSG